MGELLLGKRGRFERRWFVGPGRSQIWLVAANYMWSHAINDASLGSGVEDDFPENASCRACDRASSDEDARHSFSAYSVYRLPFGAGRARLSSPGFGRALLGGWEWDALATGRSGLPVNITVDRPSSALPDKNNKNQRPNYVSGVSLTPPGGSTPALWINAAAFAVPLPGTWGNLSRNAFNGPALWQIDTALAKHVPIKERASLEFRAECFNVLNRPQYGNPNADISAPASFGRITTLVEYGADRQRYAAPDPISATLRLLRNSRKRTRSLAPRPKGQRVPLLSGGAHSRPLRF